jgi:hypothetical protein
LAFNRRRLTFHRKAHPQEADAVTLLQAYVFFGLPLIALAIGFGALWLTRRQDQRHTPAE